MMKIGQCICVMAAFFLALLTCVGTSWADKKPVLDDDGNVITESEIKENTGSGYQIGFCIGGGILFAIPSIIGGAVATGVICDGWFYNGNFSRCSDDTVLMVFAASTLTLELVAVMGSRHIGKHLDRRRAINRIKAQRRQQEEHVLNQQETAEGIYFRLLEVAF